MSEREALTLALEQIRELHLELAAEKIFTNLALQLLVHKTGAGLDTLQKYADGELDSEDPNAERLAALVRDRSKFLINAIAGNKGVLPN